MNEDSMSRFEEELEDCGGDIELWKYRKNRENESFRGLEIDPEKMKRLETIRAKCRALARLDSGVICLPNRLTPQNRNGVARISLPPVMFSSDGRVLSVLSELFRLADDVAMAAPRLVSEDEDDEFTGPRDGREIVLSFGVHNMWKTFIKAPFI